MASLVWSGLVRSGLTKPDDQLHICWEGAISLWANQDAPDSLLPWSFFPADAAVLRAQRSSS